MSRRGIVPLSVDLIGGFVMWSPDGAGQAVRFPTRHKVIDAAVKDGEILLLIEGEQMPEVKEGEVVPRMQCVVSTGYPVAAFKPHPNDMGER